MKNFFHNKGTKERSVILLGCFVALLFNLSVSAQPLSLGDPVFQAAMSKTSAGSGGDGLIAGWKLDYSEVDFSGNGFDGSLDGTSSPSYSTGQNGNANRALTFVSDNNQSFSAPTLSALSGATQATLTCWLKRTTSTDDITFGRHSTANNRFAFLIYGDDHAYFYCENGSGTFADVTVSGTGWHFYAAVFDGSQSTDATRLLIYVDGVLTSPDYTGPIPSSLATSTDDISIGHGVLGGFSDGSADDCRIYGRVLTSGEISAMYSEGAQGE